MKHNNFLSRLTHFVANGRVSTPPPCNSHGFLRVFTDGRPTVEYTMQHTLRYAFLLLTFLLLTPSNMWGDNITFQGNETFYFDKASNSGWGHLDAPDADVYLEFANSGNNKTKSSPAQWEKQDDILKVTVPAGTYNQVHIVRTQKGNPGNIFNQFDWITLQTGKNQILNGGGWATYSSGGGDEPTTFTKGSTLYFDMNGQDWTGGHYGAIFYTSTMHNINGNDDGYWDDEHISQRGSKYTISDKSTRLIEVGNGVYSLTIPYDNATTVRVCRFSKESDTQGYLKSCSKRLAAKDLGTNNCLKLLAGGKENTWNLNAEWSTYSEPTPVSGDLYVFGAGGTNWVTGWSQNKTKAEYKMTIQNGEATKTFYNVSGVNLEFKIWDNTKQVEYTNALIEEKASSDTDPIKRIWKNGATNIDFDINGTADVTVHYNGTKIWLTAEASGIKHKVEFISLDGSVISTQNVAEGSTATKPGNPSLSGNRYVDFDKWCSNEERTQEFNFNTAINADTKVYAKWKVNSNIYLVGSLWLYTDGNNWWNDLGLPFSKNDKGIASVSFSAPKGDFYFETIKDKNWSYKVDRNHSSKSPIALTDQDGHSKFHLDAPARVTITYDGQFSVSADYDYAKKDGWYLSIDNMDLGQKKAMDDKGEIILRDVASGSHNFQVVDGSAGKYSDMYTVVGQNVLNAPFVEYDNSAMWTKVNTRWWNNIVAAQSGNYRDMFAKFTLSEKSDIKVTCNGLKVTVAILPKVYYDVTFMVDGAQYGEKQSVVENGHPTKPTDPTKTGYIFKGWSETEGGDVVDVTTVTITAAKTFYAIWAEKVTVTFNADGGQPVPENQVIEKGGKATKPATDPAKAGYNFTGWDWNFDNTINADKTINAQYSLKGVESVTLDKTELTMRVGGTTQKLTPTCAPEDVIGVSYSWEVTSGSAVSVSTTGFVSPLVKGQAVVTCTATNEVGISKTATCSITVKGEDEDCETTDESFFSYAMGTEDAAVIVVNMFDEKDNTVPEFVLSTQIVIGSKSSDQTKYYAYAYNNGDTHMLYANTTGETWYLEDAGKTGSNIPLYYVHNANNQYIYRSEVTHNNGDWHCFETLVGDLIKDDARFKWYVTHGSNGDAIACLQGMAATGQAATGTGNSPANKEKDYILGRHHWDNTWIWNNTNAVATARATGQGGGGYSKYNSYFTNTTSKEANPLFLKTIVTKDNVDYTRFSSTGSVSVTLSKALRLDDKIQLVCYNPSNAQITATLSIGTNNQTITLAANEAKTFVYPIGAANVGATSFVISASNNAFCLSSINVTRAIPTDPITPVMNWNPAITGTINKQVSTEKFTYEAVATKGAGLITYNSDNTAVATVNPTTGEVTMIAEGDAIITATMEQEGCYAEGSISYNLHLTDLPKPTITFVTVPTEMPQGLANQTIVVTTTGGDNFNLAITEGTGATLNITENTGAQITATLSMGADATNIVLTASTERTAEYAQNAVTANVAVSACIPDGANIFEFTLTGSDAAQGQAASGIIDGTVDQTALGTKGTEDNPAIVAIKKLKFTNQFVTDVNSTAQITTGKTDHSDEWYMFPTGTYDNKQMYYLKNVASGQWLYKDKSVFYGPNGGWKYYAVRTSATNEQTDVYKWMEVSKGNKKRFANRESYVSNDHEHTHNMRPCITEAANEWKTPYVGAGLSGHQGNQEWDSELVDVENVANPDMIKSVEHNSKTYYIISSEGKITINCDLKAGDVITLDMYNRQTKTDASAIITISEDATKYEYTTTNEYLCIHGITIHREKVGEFITPTLSFAEANVTRDLQNSETSYTQVPSSDVTTVATMAYASDNAKATVDADGKVTLDSSIEHGTLITVTATLPAVGCYNEATASYTIRVKNIVEGVLQTMIDATPVGETLVLEDDFIGQAGVVDKAMTIDAQGYEVGNLTLKPTANVTLSSALKVADLTLWAKENKDIQSAQLTGETNLTIGGDVWFDVDFEAGNAIEFGWYTVAVPFTVDGVYYKNSEGTRVAAKSGKDYMLYTYDSNKRAAGQNGWTKYTGNMNPGMLYLITMDDALGVSTFCFKKTNGATIGGPSEMTLQAYPATNPINAGWNGIANSTLQYRNISFSGDKVQVYSHADDAFRAVETANNTFVVGSAFFAQSEGETLKLETPAAAGTLLAPTRSTTTPNNSEWVVELTRDGKQQDRVFLSAEETADETYEIGHDLVKMAYQTPKVAQVAIAAYGVQLCDAELPWSETNEALFPLTLTAPQNGTYTLHIATAAEGTLYLLHNGQVIWNLIQSDYDLDLTKGKTTEYSLMLQRKITDIVTATDKVQGGLNVEKFIRNNRMYILKNNTVQDVLGK